MGLTLAFLAGCSSPATQNRRVYDRYAALVAERNKARHAPAVEKKKSSHSSASSSTSLNRRPLKSSSTSKKKSTTKKSSTASRSKATKKAPAKKASSPAKAAPAPKPVPPPPVQVMAPPPVAAPEVVTPPSIQPKEKPAPVQAAPVAATLLPSATAGGYTLKVGDGIQVFLRGIPSPDAIEDVIDEGGMIALPLINDVEAAGLTSSQLERRIRKMYLDRDIYRNISVNVVVPTRYYFIQGEIRAPGRFQIMSATRVSQAIAGAGGYTEYASGRVLVKRNGKIFKNIRNAQRLERTPDDDILLEPDDIIEVKRSLW